MSPYTRSVRRWIDGRCVVIAVAVLGGCGDTSAPGTTGTGSGASGSGDTGTGTMSGGHGPDSGFTYTLPTGGTTTEGPIQTSGLFVDPARRDRARARAAGNEEPFATQGQLVAGRADTALAVTADPFHMDDVTTIRFGWCDPGDDTDDTLKEATDKLEAESDHMRTLALQFALTSDERYADKAVELMGAWAEGQTIVNVYDFDPDFEAGTIDGMTDGSCTDRPWNFALDAMWQTYGLINAADAYLLLTRNGYPLGADGPLLRGWLRELAAAVNSSFHAWTRWADAHPGSSSFERYRADNHLSWSLAGLIAAAAALGDEELAAYVLEGGTWDDGRSGAYANPSHIRDVIDRAIESGTGSENEGRIYEELILRDPPIGYALFHLWAMALVAEVARVHFGDDVYDYAGMDDDAGLRLAFDRYAEFILGRRTSPMPAQESDLSVQWWLYELAHARFAAPIDEEVLVAQERNPWIVQSIGPVTLLVGDDL